MPRRDQEEQCEGDHKGIDIIDNIEHGPSLKKNWKEGCFCFVFL